jgi:glycosyltransferase involved in cell wall biosynthesis
MPRASVIISVYNNIHFLRLVLAGFERQTERDFEIIISDDGSGRPFVEAVEALAAAGPLNIRHVWHPDEGFRKNRILNRSIQAATAPYLIFVDGDCIPHPEFVAEHLRHAEKGVCLAGRRVDLSPGITAGLTPERVSAGVLQSPGMLLRMFGDYFRMRLFHVMNGVYVRNLLLRRFFNRKDRGLLGANFSLFKEDILAVNGFDERYNAPTFGEDSDIELRLRLHGIRFRSLLSIAVQYHCHHPLLPRPESSYRQYLQAMEEQRAYTPYGIVREHGDKELGNDNDG